MTSNELLSYLRDAAQGASNSAASNVSGPVDLLAWLLRKGGVPVPQNALGGSQWMAEKGLTAQPKNALAGMAGETLGMVGPIVAAAKAPQIANALLKVGENAAARPMLNPQTGAIVWHGSPHKFDKFDAGKIGTGEGAQAYGHGHYSADLRDVAIEYKEALGAGRGASDADTIARVLNAVGGDAAKAASELQRRAQYANIPGGKEKLLALAKQVASGFDPRGNLYKIDLPDEHIAKMLDWDKPLSQQAPEVQKAAAMFGPNAGDLTGQELYKKAAGFDSMVNVAMKTGGDAARLKTVFPQASDAQIAQAIATAKNAGGNDRIAAQMLRDAGIPGVRYLDGGSRGAGAGTSNYVVFPGNENLLRILERNGVPIGQ